MISAVDLLKGLAVGSEMDKILVEGANGGLHTNYEGKANAAADALLNHGYDFAYVHVEAPDEMGHQGLLNEKIESIEYLDKLVTRLIVEALEKRAKIIEYWFFRIIQHRFEFVHIQKIRFHICFMTAEKNWEVRKNIAKRPQKKAELSGKKAIV